MSRLPQSPVDVAVPELRTSSKLGDIERRLSEIDAIEAEALVGTTGQPAFQNSWVNFDTRVARFYKHKGHVYLLGLVKDGTVGQAAFTLPVGYRISTGTDQFHFPVVSNSLFGAVYIKANGDVIPAVGSNAWFDLSGIVFRARA